MGVVLCVCTVHGGLHKAVLAMHLAHLHGLVFPQLAGCPWMVLKRGQLSCCAVMSPWLWIGWIWWWVDAPAWCAEALRLAASFVAVMLGSHCGGSFGVLHATSVPYLDTYVPCAHMAWPWHHAGQDPWSALIFLVWGDCRAHRSLLLLSVAFLGCKAHDAWQRPGLVVLLQCAFTLCEVSVTPAAALYIKRLCASGV